MFPDQQQILNQLAHLETERTRLEKEIEQVETAFVQTFRDHPYWWREYEFPIKGNRNVLQLIHVIPNTQYSYFVNIIYSDYAGGAWVTHHHQEETIFQLGTWLQTQQIHPISAFQYQYWHDLLAKQPEA